MAIAVPNILQGTGSLYWAPLGSDLPTATAAAGVFTDTWPVAWLGLGATREGSKFGYQTSMEAIQVAEFMDPIAFATTGRSGSMEFDLANFSLTNIKRALNGGGIVTTGSGDASINTYTPPAPGEEVRSMLGWESDDGTVRILAPRCIAETNIEASFGRAPAFASIPVKFNFEIAVGTGAPFQLISVGTARA